MATGAPLAIVGPEGKGWDDDTVAKIRETLAPWHLQVTLESDVGKTSADGRLVLLISMDFKQLCHEAEHEELLKQLRDDTDVADSLKFEDDTSRALAEFRVETASSFVGYDDAVKDGSGFFEPWEILLLTTRRLNRVGCTDDVDATKTPSVPFLHDLMRDGYSTVALHTSSPQWNPSDFPCSVAGVDDLHCLFGDGVAAYFVFMRTFTLWLVPPAIVAVLLKVFREKGSSIDTSTRMPLYELGMILWSAAFPIFLDRANAHFSCRWGRLDTAVNEAPRPEYYGDVRTSPITGQPEIHYPAWKRWLKYMVSIIVTSAMLCVAFGVMILSLNLQGYIHEPDTDEARGLETSFGSPFLVRPLAELARPGRILDPSGEGDPLFGGWITMLPVIGHSITILCLNTIYRSIATELTKWENHRTEQQAENSLIVKRFLFECFDCYIALFYIAFYERDVRNLRAELISLYNVDCLRRLLLETVVPLVKLRVTEMMQKSSDAARKKDDNSPDDASGGQSEVQRQVARDESEEFDDYLEMVIQFGYVTLFAGVFPIASLLSIGCNLVEMYSDSIKLKFAYQRPKAYAASAMPRTWHFIIRCMCWLSILTNVLVFGWVSEQAKELFGKKYLFKDGATENDDHTVKKAGVWLLFWLENFLLVASAAVSHLPAQPRWVKHAVRGREYRRMELARAATRQRCNE